jgi:GrpB-like predicted nucleotidyltransferase (UPF0157 family)
MYVLDLRHYNGVGGHNMSKPLSEMSLEELWQLFPVELVPHNPAWANQYAEEESQLTALLDGSMQRIDHIGSTAVPGLLAKPIVDILLQVSAGCDLASLKEKLLADGWLLMAEDSAYGELDLNKGYTPDGFAAKVYHLHVRRIGDWDELRFRDYLISHPAAVAEYAELKRQLLAEHKYNRDAYTEAKTEFIKACVAKSYACPVRLSPEKPSVH